MDVGDNGSGVAASDYVQLTQRYATSKIRQFEDVEQIRSFGFRGEALSSLCALSALSIVTKTADQAHATELHFNHAGEIISQTPAVFAGAHGSCISIRKLFEHLPVRQKEFVKHVSTSSCMPAWSSRARLTRLLGSFFFF